MGLRLFYVARGGWVAGMGGCIAGCADPLEKSASSSTDTSIYRLPPIGESSRFRGFFAQKMKFVMLC
jgi:lipid-binding SYLF domain-containing protein